MSADTQFKTTKSSGNVEYTVRDVPTEVDLNTVDYQGYAGLESVGGYPVHHIYTKCSEIKSKKLPLEANPREPSKTPQVKAMRDTLNKEPSEFVKKNNGVVILADSVTTTEDGHVSISFEKDEGVCNGGHTYFAIVTHDGELPEEAVVHLEVIEIPDDIYGDQRKERIIEIARARNNNNRLDKRSEADFLGYYDEYKKVINDPSQVSWHEGDSRAKEDAIDAVHFIRLMKSFDIFAYYHPVYNNDSGHHKSLATSRSRVHSSWLKQMEKAVDDEETRRPFYYLTPFAETVLWMRDLISHSLENDDLKHFRKTKLFKEYIDQGKRQLRFDDFENNQGIKVKQTLEVMFLGLFRTNIFIHPAEESSVRYTGWFIDPQDLWNERKVDVLEDMAEYFKEVDSDPKQFIRVSSPYEKNLFKLGLRQSPPAPEQIIDLETRDKFEKVPDSNEESATHYFETAREKEGESGLFELDDLSEVSRTTPLYCEKH